MYSKKATMDGCCSSFLSTFEKKKPGSGGCQGWRRSFLYYFYNYL
jgi:hypothetical protein